MYTGTFLLFSGKTELRILILVLLPVLSFPLFCRDSDYIASWINDRRAEAGLSPLEEEETLRTGALSYARELSERGIITHRDRDNRGPWERYSLAGGTALAAGEILGTSSAGNPLDDILEAWWESPTHREQILNPRWNCLGIGISEKDNIRIAAVEFSSALIRDYHISEREQGFFLEFTTLSGLESLVFINILAGESLRWTAGKGPSLFLGPNPFPLFLEVSAGGETVQWQGNRIVLYQSPVGK